MHKIPSEDELNTYYSLYSYSEAAYLSPVTIKSYQLLLDEFEQYRSSGKILDVGCGRGWFLEEARKKGWEVFGNEYSDKAVEICRSKGIHVTQGELDADSFESADFDVITSFEVIEHLSFPAKHIEEIAKLLRPGGLFYCTTPNFNAFPRFIRKTDYSIICYPEHLSYFTKSTLCKLAEPHGLKKTRFRSTGISLTLMRKRNNQPEVSMNSKDHPDEKLRKSIEGRKYLLIIKKILNFCLTLTNTGVTLKGYFINRQ